MGEDIWDPPWEEDPTGWWSEGLHTATYQQWEFSQGFDVVTATLENPYGDPYVELINADYPNPDGPQLGPDGETYINTIHVGSDGTSGGIDIIVYNDPNPNDWKVVFVQITADKAPGPSGPTTNPPGSVTYPQPAIQHAGTWYTFTAEIWIPGNPAMEIIHYDFPFSTDISEIVVHTICIPEPVTMSLLGVGGLMLLRRRRR